jgi:arsenate reductase (thioredoxin)
MGPAQVVVNGRDDPTARYIEVVNRTRILFVCTGNACRSQMAEGWTRALWNDRFDVHSAGVMPAGVSSRATRVMSEAGVDISAHTSKHVVDVMHIPFDYVITVCDWANEACPSFPGGAKKLHFGFEDPPTLAMSAKTLEEGLGHFRRVRDEIKAFVERLPEILGR